MSSFSKNHLSYDDYSWTVYATDSPQIAGKPDQTQLNRKEGHEMVYFINYFLNEYNGLGVEEGAKIEKLVREVVPPTIHSQQEVEEWIVRNWTNFQ